MVYLVELVVHKGRVMLRCGHGGDEHRGVSVRSHGVCSRTGEVEGWRSPCVESLLVIGLKEDGTKG